jgi:hypothetical protein
MDGACAESASAKLASAGQAEGREEGGTEPEAAAALPAASGAVGEGQAAPAARRNGQEDAEAGEGRQQGGAAEASPRQAQLPEAPAANGAAVQFLDRGDATGAASPSGRVRGLLLLLLQFPMQPTRPCPAVVT